MIRFHLTMPNEFSVGSRDPCTNTGDRSVGIGPSSPSCFAPIRRLCLLDPNKSLRIQFYFPSFSWHERKQITIQWRDVVLRRRRQQPSQWISSPTAFFVSLHHRDCPSQLHQDLIFHMGLIRRNPFQLPPRRAQQRRH